MNDNHQALGPFRPPLAFRVGVTGNRDLLPGDMPAIEAAVADVLDEVFRVCFDVAQTDAARAVYAPNNSGVAANPVIIQLSALSPLARGGDQLFARAALARGFDLCVPTPFPLAIYEQDFVGELESFHDLLSKAKGRVLEIDGDRGGDYEWRSYEAVGRLVARNCDLLIAIWDEDTPPKGRGGTRDTILFSLQSGVPVWWIHAANKRPPALVTHFDELVRPRSEGAMHALGELVKVSLLPPPTEATRTEGFSQIFRLVTSPIGATIGYESPATEDPLQTFLAARDLPSRRFWKFHKWLFSALASGLSSYVGAGARLGGYWWTAYAAPDRLSLAYAMRYRSAYVYIIGLAAAAVVASSIASSLDPVQMNPFVCGAGLLEFGLLALMLILVFAAQWAHWHDRWITYRLLAELCRKQSALALLGWSLPILEAVTNVQTEEKESGWVGWYFGAVSRAAPLAVGTLSGKALEKIRKEIAGVLVADQIGYHQHRAKESRAIAARLLTAGKWCFFATLPIVLYKNLVYFSSESSTISNLASSVLSAIAASILGLRSYAELDVLANQSGRMARHLEVVRDRIESAAVGEPLASQALGYDLSRLIAVMMSDVTGWAQLFRMKGIETG